MTDALDPRTPVLVGAGQLNRRVDDGETPLEPVDLMVEALRLAERDAGGAGLLGAVQSVRVMGLLSWRYRDPAALVAERVGATPRHTALTVMGGNYPQTVLNGAAREIARGELDVAVICGAEAWRTRSAVRKAGAELPWTVQGEEVAPSDIYGAADADLNGPAEAARGIVLPVQIYPMFDVALRAAAGLGVAEHRERLGRLWSRFSDVAAKNPHAWIQRHFTPDEVATPSPQNRLVGFPYTKVMNSNNNVEQGAAVVLCSVERARALGIPRDRWVFPLAGTDAHDHWQVSHRADLRSSPAIRLAGGRCLALAGVGIGDVDHFDLYSCFPSAVQIAAAELGTNLDRQLTVTGGMSFAGGPWNNYVTHSIATMAGVLRSDPSSLGLVTANGGFTTKHSFGLYSTEPPADGYRWESCQDEVDRLPRREAVTTHAGDATLEAYTVMYDREGEPEQALAACLTPQGARTWARSTEAALLRALVEREWVGSPVRLDGEGALLV